MCPVAVLTKLRKQCFRLFLPICTYNFIFLSVRKPKTLQCMQSFVTSSKFGQDLFPGDRRSFFSIFAWPTRHNFRLFY